ncbi:MAG TPA: serine/threonine-protein kinase [Gaiellaceae bacterium]
MADELVAGRYRLDTLLGGGGMSEVWLAEDTQLGRRVALKFLGRGADPARFEREAHAVAALADPNICRLYDYGEAAGRPFMVLEFLPGGTLEERLVPGEPYSDDETERLARELASGLAHAHARGLVHRDLKPANVLFDEEGRAKIADFGIARLGGARTLTETGTLLGTAAYISPEQAQAQPATPASDVYAFGVMLYRLLSGRLPFEAESPVELARMHIQERPRPLRELRPDAPPALAALADAALAKDPAARPPDGAALVEALGPGATAVDAPTLVAEARRPERRFGPIPLPLAVAAVVLAAIAVAGALVAVLIGGSDTANPAVSSTAQQTHTGRTATTAGTASLPTHGNSTTGRTKTAATTATPPPPPTPPPTPPPPPPPPPPTPPPTPSVPTTLPTTVTIPVTTSPPPPLPEPMP